MEISTSAGRSILGVLTLFFLVASVMLWNGKWTFLISNYKKYDPNKMDMARLHHVNAITWAVAMFPLCVLAWIFMFTGNRVLVWGGIIWMFAINLAEHIYEKTGDRFPVKE